MFEAAEAFDVRFLEYFARLGRRYVMSLPDSNQVASAEKMEMARIKVEQAMREIVDGQAQFAEKFINAAYDDEPGTVVYGLGMTVWASAGPMMEDELRKQGKKILEQACKKRPGNRFLLRAMAVVARQERQFATAHRYFDLALRLNPKDVETVIDKIELFMQAEEYDKAAGMIAKAAKAFPGEASLADTQAKFARDSKRCPKCGTYMRYSAPFCPKCKLSFL